MYFAFSKNCDFFKGCVALFIRQLHGVMQYTKGAPCDVLDCDFLSHNEGIPLRSHSWLLSRVFLAPALPDAADVRCESLQTSCLRLKRLDGGITVAFHVHVSAGLAYIHVRLPTALVSDFVGSFNG